VALEPAAVLVGRVVDSTGKPMAAASVRAVQMPFQLDPRLHEAVPTYATGRYTVRGVPMGYGYTVSATASGYGRDELAVEIGDNVNEPVALRDLVLKRPDVSPSKAALERRDQPVQDTEVTGNGKNRP